MYRQSINKKIYEFKKDEILYVSCGEYSDYEIISVVKVLQDFDAEKIKEVYINNINNKENKRQNTNEFLKFMLDLNLIEELNYREFRLGGYGDLLEY
jgi:hypothetical protein